LPSLVFFYLALCLAKHLLPRILYEVNMTPNLFLLGKLIVTPQKWFTPRSGSKSPRKQEHWDGPIPGMYEYIPGRGWYLVAVDPEHNTSTPLQLPQAITYCRVLHRHLLRQDFERRRRFEHVKGERGGFFLLDDEITWIKAWDETGASMQGPFERWVIDSETRLFRPMTYGDVAEVKSRQNSKVLSLKSLSTPSPQLPTTFSARASLRTPSTTSSSTSIYVCDTRGSSNKDSCVQSTASTTPQSKVKDPAGLSATDLRSRLLELGDD
jgi:hypothetical protein